LLAGGAGGGALLPAGCFERRFVTRDVALCAIVCGGH
jgi:hypothetical protein